MDLVGLLLIGGALYLVVKTDILKNIIGGNNTDTGGDTTDTGGDTGTDTGTDTGGDTTQSPSPTPKPKTTPTPKPTPTPSGGTTTLPTKGRIIWSSTTWKNSRDPTKGPKDAKFGSKDQGDQQMEISHAGSGCSFKIANGEFTLGGDQCRLYILGNNFNSQMILDGKWNGGASNDNFSLRLRSRHNEGGATTNRFGGYGVAFHLGGEVDFAREDYHNVHTSFGGTKIAAFKSGQYYNLGFSAQNFGKTVVMIAYVNGKKVAQGVDKSPKSYMVDTSKTYYSWIRHNGSKTITMKNASIREIGPLGTNANFVRAFSSNAYKSYQGRITTL